MLTLEHIVIVSTAKTVPEQIQELNPLVTLGTVVTHSIKIIKYGRGRRAVQFLPQTAQVRKALTKICNRLNSKSG